MTFPGRVVVEVLPELGGDNYLILVLFKRLGQYLLPVPTALGVGGVEEVYSHVEGTVQQPRVKLLGVHRSADGARFVLKVEGMVCEWL